MPQELAGAASALLYGLLTGPPRSATVLGAFPGAVYLSSRVRGWSEEADGERGVGAQVLAIVRTDALRLPCSILLAPEVNVDLSTLIPADDQIVLGAGCLQLPAATISVTRWWQPPRPQRIGGLSAAQVTAMRQQLPSLPAAVNRPVSRLAEETTAMAARARSLVGLGPGLTPAGDDVLAALLVTLFAGPATAQALGSTIATAILPDAETRTTALSAALLRDAARGTGIPQLIDFVNVLSADQRHAASVLTALLAVGSSSGTALAHGVLIAAQTMLTLAGTTSTALEVA